jgi:2-dehydro-3-deoxyphosphogluconate aldolase/(4S)-4-hydroxy-2-oxoglutarate aldolase
VFSREPIMAIVRGGDGSNLADVCDTLVGAGIRHLELTTNTPGWQAVVARLASHDGITVGVGTVTQPDQVAEAHGLGAGFIVAPDTNHEVGQAAARAALPWYPGALTPTEILRAWRWGATAVKIFPWRAMGGVQYLRDLRGPLPHIPLIPTGGVDLDHIRPLLELGVVGVGIGSPLLGSVFSDGSLTALEGRCRAVLDAVAAARSDAGGAR